MVQQGPAKSQEESRSLEKRLLALRAAIMERLMYSSRAELAELPVGSFASAARPGEAGTATAAWPRGISAGQWEPGWAAGGDGEPWRGSPGPGQQHRGV